jgi:hypothetical protein
MGYSLKRCLWTGFVRGGIIGGWGGFGKSLRKVKGTRDKGQGRKRGRRVRIFTGSTGFLKRFTGWGGGWDQGLFGR